MSKMVRYMVNLLFQDVEESAEVAALRDEVLANCEAHYEDLLSRGLSEDDALAAVTESLQGMEEVVNSYPKKNSKQEETPEADPFEKPADDTSEIDRIVLELRAWNARIVPSGDGRVNVRCEGGNAQNIDIRFEGSCLTVTENQNMPDGHDLQVEMKKMKWDSFDALINGVKAVLGAAMSTVSSAMEMTSGDLVIEVPQSLDSVHHRSISGSLSIEGVDVAEIRSNATSGDIQVSTAGETVESAVIRTTSGDISLNVSVCRAELNSMSGDVVLNGSAGQLTAGSVSGDILVNGGEERMGDIHVSSTSGDVRFSAESAGVDKLNARTVSGDVMIELPDFEDSVHAELHTVSGDCRNDRTDGGLGAAVRINVQTVSGDITIH